MDRESFEYAERRVAGPAIGLIVTAAFSGVLLLLALGVDVLLLLSGAADQAPQPQGMSKHSQILIRMGWSLLMLITDIVIVVGAFHMKKLNNRGLSMLACSLALVPCLGPCFVLGVPFGIWGIIALNDEDVRSAFRG